MATEQIPKVKGRSCDVCRRRKIRCDGPIIPPGCCTSCSKNHSPCTFSQSARRGSNDDARKANESLKNECMSLKQENTRLKNENLSLRAELRSLCGPSQSDSLFHQEGHRSTPADEPAVTDDDLPGDELASRFQQFSFDSVKNKFFRPAGILAIANTAMALKEKYLGGPMTSHPRRRLFWDMLPWEKGTYDCRPHRLQYVYPAADLINSLVELFFKHVHPIVPVLHRHSFEKSVADGLYLTDFEFGGLLLAVMAIASRFSGDPRVLVQGDETLLSIHEIQMYCLLAIFTLGTSRPECSGVFMGLGITLLQVRREYRLKRDSHDVDFETEMWRRLFWAYVILDRMTCVYHGRPPIFDLADYDVDLPLEVDDEYWDRGFVQPLGKPSVGSYFVYHARLCEILGDTMRWLYGSKKMKLHLGYNGLDWEHRIVAELDSTMNGFSDSLPPHLRWDPDCPTQGTFFEQSLVLYVGYHHIQIMIHRPYIHKTSALAAPSLSICTSAARKVLRTASIPRLGRRSRLTRLSPQARIWLNSPRRQLLPTLTNPVFVSGIILILNLFGTQRAGASEEVTKDLAHLETAMEVMKFLESRLQPAGRLWDLLDQLRCLDPLPTNCPASGAIASRNQCPPPVPGGLPQGPLEPFFSEPSDGRRSSDLKPGVSIEQLLADTDSSVAMDDVFDDELMSLWMAVPTDIANLGEWDTYIENRHVNTDWPPAASHGNI
ncbi:fungal-specific transcription factor domain-containing protein [Mycena filopes]|nr:fungal-specific transcription factor domain-containing protein [Mycena filopes]